MLYPMKPLVERAFNEDFGIPQPDFVNVDLAASYLHAAAQMNSPIILGFGEEYIEASGAVDLKHLVKIIDALSSGYDVPVVLHLDHGSSYEVCAKAINAGFTSVMIDGSSLEYEENVKLTRRVVDLAKLSGVTVEGELGRLKTGRGYDLAKGDSQVLTDPEVAKHFVQETGVDALAISIGSVHGEYTGTPNIRLDLLQEIKEATHIPLVLHGASGIPFNTLTECAESGITKVNIFTDFVKEINQHMHMKYSKVSEVQIPELVYDLKIKISEKLKEYIAALGSENKK